MSTETVTRLREQVTKLRARVSELELALEGSTSRVPFEWGLTPYEATIASMLIEHEIVSVKMIAQALYNAHYVADDQFATIRVMVWKMRQKLQPFGVTVENHRGHGYAIPSEVRARLAGARAA